MFLLPRDNCLCHCFRKLHQLPTVCTPQSEHVMHFPVAGSYISLVHPQIGARTRRQRRRRLLQEEQPLLRERIQVNSILVATLDHKGNPSTLRMRCYGLRSMHETRCLETLPDRLPDRMKSTSSNNHRSSLLDSQCSVHVVHRWSWWCSRSRPGGMLFIAYDILTTSGCP